MSRPRSLKKYAADIERIAVVHADALRLRHGLPVPKGRFDHLPDEPTGSEADLAAMDHERMVRALAEDAPPRELSPWMAEALRAAEADPRWPTFIEALREATIVELGDDYYTIAEAS